MSTQPNWEGFARAIVNEWPVRDIDGAELFEAALKFNLIRPIPGGFDPEEHNDNEGIYPDPGDPWYEYNYKFTK